MVKNCLWCNEEGDGYFCKGGGPTIGVSNTGEKTVTKSYCYNDFLGMLDFTQKTEMEYTPEEQEYTNWKESVREWYNNLPFVRYMGVVGEKELSQPE